MKNSKMPFLRRLMSLSLTVVLVLAIMAVPAFAGGKGKGNTNKGGGPGGGGGGNGDGSIAITQVAPYHYGDTIVFAVSTTTTDRPFVTVECFKSGARVYSNTVGHFQDWYDEWGVPDHVLASLAWNGGDADCTGTLWYQDSKYRKRTLTSMGFQVAG